MALPDNSQVVYPAYAFTNLLANATTVIRTGSGLLHAICVNTKGASANTISIYDAVTATNPIGVIDSTVAPGTFFFNCIFNTGLTIVIGTGTAANITVLYR